jgi:hypothetical protein
MSVGTSAPAAHDKPGFGREDVGEMMIVDPSVLVSIQRFVGQIHAPS